MKTWGITITDAKAAWKEVDADGAGMVLFDEFCNWAIKKKLDLDDDDDDDDNTDSDGPANVGINRN